jgi:phage shock protein E
VFFLANKDKKMKIIEVLVITMMLGVLVASSLAFGDDNSTAITIDTRTQAEWDEGHLEGAVLIPYDMIVQGIATIAPDKNTNINLYCRTGRRSGIALETLQNAGYINLKNLGSLENASTTLGQPIVK